MRWSAAIIETTSANHVVGLGSSGRFVRVVGSDRVQHPPGTIDHADSTCSQLILVAHQGAAFGSDFVVRSGNNFHSMIGPLHTDGLTNRNTAGVTAKSHGYICGERRQEAIGAAERHHFVEEADGESTA
jgi:hypothetical protein